MASLLRRQLERVHRRAGRVEAQLAEERRERQRLEEEVVGLRAAEELHATDAPTATARRLVEDAVVKAMAWKRENEALRVELEAERTARLDAEAQRADSASLRRALHNLSSSFDEQERYLKTSLDESVSELERHRQARLKCADKTQRLAETLRELMLDLAQDDDIDDAPGSGEDDHDDVLRND